MKNKLYYILSCAANGTSLDVERLRGVSPSDWAEVYSLGKAQGVTGLLFEKVKALPKEVAPPREVVLQWMSHTMSVERQTKALFQKCAEFAELMHEQGMQTMVLKGLAISGYYPNPWHREYGDLDCYLYEEKEGAMVWDGCYEAGNRAAEAAGLLVKRGFYKHSHIQYKGMEVENHQFSLPIKDGDEVKAMERELRRLVALPGGVTRIGQTQLMRPSADFNALFLTAHSLSHFLFESIKLRHVMDWAFFLKSEQEHVDWDNFWRWCERMHYTRFVKCLNYICEHHLGMELVAGVKGEEDEKVPALAERILDDVFGGYSLYTQNHTGFMHRVMIIKSYLRGLWKFHQVHQRNAFWLLARRMKNYFVKDVRLD